MDFRVLVNTHCSFVVFSKYRCSVDRECSNVATNGNLCFSVGHRDIRE